MLHNKESHTQVIKVLVSVKHCYNKIHNIIVTYLWLSGYLNKHQREKRENQGKRLLPQVEKLSHTSNRGLPKPHARLHFLCLSWTEKQLTQPPLHTHPISRTASKSLCWAHIPHIHTHTSLLQGFLSSEGQEMYLPAPSATKEPTHLYFWKSLRQTLIPSPVPMGIITSISQPLTKNTPYFTLIEPRPICSNRILVKTSPTIFQFPNVARNLSPWNPVLLLRIQPFAFNRRLKNKSVSEAFCGLELNMLICRSNSCLRVTWRGQCKSSQFTTMAISAHHTKLSHGLVQM